MSAGQTEGQSAGQTEGQSAGQTEGQLVLRRAPEVVDAQVGDVLVLYDPVGNRYARLNRTAAAVWYQLSGPRSVRELAGGLTGRYGVAPGRAVRDVAALASELARRGLVIADQAVAAGGPATAAGGSGQAAGHRMPR